MKLTDEMVQRIDGSWQPRWPKGGPPCTSTRCTAFSRRSAWGAAAPLVNDILAVTPSAGRGRPHRMVKVVSP